MSRFLTCLPILVGATTALALHLGAAENADTLPITETVQTTSRIPYAADEPLYEGDDILVVSDAPLIGDEEKTLLTLGKGLPLVVRDVHDQWVMVDVNYQGQSVQGWVDRKYLALISPEAPGLLHADVKDIPKRLAELHASSEEQLSRSDFFKSLQTCSAVLKIDPTSAIAFYRRGHCLQMMDEFEKAIADFDRAIELEPKYELAYLARGDAQFSRDDFDKALADYNSALEVNPKSAGAHYMQGRCWYQKGNNEKAIEEYNAALEIDPDYAWAFAHRGDAKFALNDIEAAIADLDKATQIDPSFDWAVARRGDVWYFGKKDLDRAIADYSYAHTLNPRNSWAVHQRGHCFETKNDFARAVADYSDAVSLDPNYWDFRTNLAWVLATCPVAAVRNGERAVQEATHACELTEWKDSFALGALAAASAEVGEFDKAVELGKKALEQKSDGYDLKTAESILEVFRSHKPYHEE